MRDISKINLRKTTYLMNKVLDKPSISHHILLKISPFFTYLCKNKILNHVKNKIYIFLI